MFIREKLIGTYAYVYLVETVREGGKIKQRIIRSLGRKEAVEAAGDLDRLARSAARLSQRSMVLSSIEATQQQTLHVSTSALRCCLNGFGRRAALPRCSNDCSPGAASNLRWSARCSSPRCIG